jgi:hypothetical protein
VVYSNGDGCVGMVKERRELCKRGEEEWWRCMVRKSGKGEEIEELECKRGNEKGRGKLEDDKRGSYR